MVLSDALPGRSTPPLSIFPPTMPFTEGTKSTKREKPAACVIWNATSAARSSSVAPWPLSMNFAKRKSSSRNGTPGLHQLIKGSLPLSPGAAVADPTNW